MHHGARRALRAVARFVVAATVAGSLAVVGGAAVAQECPRPFADEAHLLSMPDECRRTYLLNAGAGNYVSRDHIWREHALYLSLGFNEDFLSWAPSTTVEITADSQDMWGYCTDKSRSFDARCPDDKVEYDFVRDSFANFPVTLHAIKAGKAVIYLGCANSAPVIDVPRPAPTLVGTKFHDANGNRVRDAGEKALAGVGVTLVLEHSLAGDPTGAVTTAVTDEHGRYAFDMHGSRPGTYRVDEALPDGWRQTTDSPRITLDWGAGDGEFALPDLGNQRVADIAKASFEVLTAPDRLEVGREAEIVVRATVVNLGAFPEVTATDVVEVVPPADCTATVLDPERPVTLRTGVPVVLDFRVLTKCDHRSDHRWTFHDRLVPAGDFHDPVPANNTASVTLDRPVFEQVDVSVADPHVTCLRPTAPTRYECTVTSTISNAATATPLATRATTTLTGSADCLIDGPATRDLVLASGASAALSESFVATCAPGAHTFLAVVEVAETEPHAEESDGGDNVTRIRWLQLDVKPNSDPSSINVDKQGVVPVAILSTPDFDAVREVVVGDDTPRFGATGYEDSLVGCAAGGEDVDGNGLPDLVCRFDTARAGLNCQTTLGRMSGTLQDGTPWEGQDAVKITPCRG